MCIDSNGQEIQDILTKAGADDKVTDQVCEMKTCKLHLMCAFHQHNKNSMLITR